MDEYKKYIIDMLPQVLSSKLSLDEHLVREVVADFLKQKAIIVPKVQKKITFKKVERVVKDKESRKKGSLEGKSFISKSDKKWTFGKLMGSGGFGAVYEVEEDDNLIIKTGGDNLPKGKDSGIFLEKSIYSKLKGGESHGIPEIVDSGRLDKSLMNRDEYFIVMPKFEKSMEDAKLEAKDVKRAMKSILSSFHYLSQKGYIHLDVKPENIMKRGDDWFLIDYGMAEKYVGKETKMDPKKIDNGTTWFMARDVHRGRVGRKADLESLVYTLLKTIKGNLPWMRERKPKESEKVYKQFVLEQKVILFARCEELNIEDSFKKFIKHVDEMEPGTDPDYKKISKYFD